MGDLVVGVSGSRTDEELVEDEEDTSEAREHTLEVDILDTSIEGSWAVVDLRNRDDFVDDEDEDREGVRYCCWGLSTTKGPNHSIELGRLPVSPRPSSDGYVAL